MIAILLDEDSMDRDLESALAAITVNVVRADAGGRGRSPDNEQLDYATNQGMTVYTANVKDFRALHTRYMMFGMNHAGIIVRDNQQMPVGAQLRGLRAILAAFPTRESMANQLLYLENWVDR